MGCANNTFIIKKAFDGGNIYIGMAKEETQKIIGHGELAKAERLENGEILEIKKYSSFNWWGVADIYWIVFKNDKVFEFGQLPDKPRYPLPVQ